MVHTHARTQQTQSVLGDEVPYWKGHLIVVLKVEKVLYIHSPHLQFLPARDSKPQTFSYVSDSLTIRPRLPPFQ